MTRSFAADLIRQVAAHAFHTKNEDLLKLLKLYGVEVAACGGEAHKNAFIDNCGLCAPEWGVLISGCKKVS